MKTLALLLLLPLTCLAENEIGFIERFALAADREKALGELIPGSEEFYFFHALHYQNLRDTTKLNALLDQWSKRSPEENPARRTILNREYLINYDNDPQGTLKYLIERLNLRLDHQQEARDQKPDLPTQLDPARIAREVYLNDALSHDQGLQSLTQEALAALIRDQVPLKPEQRRSVLQQLQRPDVPNLVQAIIADLKEDKSRRFGGLPIHRSLLPEQLNELLQIYPNLIAQQDFVHARLRKMAPNADVNIEFDEAEREAWLDRISAFAEKLPPSQNTLRSRILYLRLDHDRKRAVYDREHFLSYLKLPRNLEYINLTWLKTISSGYWCDLNADLSDPLLIAPPVGNDEALVRDYFLQLFAAEAKPDSEPEKLLSPWTDYVRESWLKPVLAEALITQGIGDPDRWAPLLTPTAFQKLKDRVDIEFPVSNTAHFSPGDAIEFDVIVKNTPKLIIKIFELNTRTFFETQNRQLNTDIHLDGLVANSEETHAFESGPFTRTRQTFKFPSLTGKRGAWLIEFIGGGRSSRALIRTGQWHILQQTGPSGDLVLVLDEKNQPVKEAVVWFEGRKLVRDEKLDRIVIPFTNNPGSKHLIIGDAAGSFATLTSFTHHAETYQLDAQFHIEREQLLARREATLVVRTALMVGDSQLSPELMTEPKLTITTSTQDGIHTTLEVRDLKLSAGRDLTHVLKVPERLASLTAVLSGKVEMLSAGGAQTDLSAEKKWTLNGIDQTDAVNDGHLSTFDGQRVFELLGKNGESIADQQVLFTLKHREFSRTQTFPLRTDGQGRVQLGRLDNIERVTARCPNGRESSWPIQHSDHTFTRIIQIREGDAVRIPFPVAFAGQAAPTVSLISQSAGTFVENLSNLVKFEPGLVTVAGLSPGDYSLRLPHEDQIVEIKVTKGDIVGGWALGQHRQLELKGNAPLVITAIENDAEFITVKLANTTPLTRVHVTATRFDSGTSLFAGLAGFTRFGAASGTPARHPNLFSGGREIGDEYRYILERRYAKRYPGNMLTRPGLLLHPWEVRSTDQEELSLQEGAAQSATAGGITAKRSQAKTEPSHKGKEQVAPEGGTNWDFLAESAPAIYNLVPDKDGIVRIARKALGDRQNVQIYAEDLHHAAWQTLALPEAPTQWSDQRLMKNLDPDKPFAQKKEVTVLKKGESLVIADILTTELETYDSLSSIHTLFTSLNADVNLAKFDFILEWSTLSAEAKQAKYSEFACHELNFFLSRKDSTFFNSVIKPYLANKKDKTFMDDYLLERDLKRYLEPWAYARLNIVERILLAHQIKAEAPHAARHVRELWELLPPDPEATDRRFETALSARSLSTPFDAPEIPGDFRGAKELLQRTALERQGSAYISSKINQIIFPSIQFNAASLEEAIEFLRVKSRDLDTNEADPAKRGVNLILKTGDTPVSSTISIDLKDVPLGEALRYVTELAGMKFKVEPSGIVIVPISETSTEIYQRIFAIPPTLSEVIKNGTPLIDLLKSHGITFSDGTSATHDNEFSRIVVRNTEPMLDLVETLIDSLMTGKDSLDSMTGGGVAAAPAADPFGAPPAISHGLRSGRSALSDDSFNGRIQMGDLDARGFESAESPSNTLNFTGSALMQSARREIRVFFRSLGSTREWAENNYHELPITEQNETLVTANGFWRDYAAWVAAGSQGAFVSANVAEATQNFTEMMLALAVLELPFEAPDHSVKTEDAQFTLTAGGPCIAFHKQIQPAILTDDPQGQVLLSQSFFRQGDRYRQEGNERFEKYVSAEFLTGVTYGANIVVTNPTSHPVKATVLLQIPQGALPVKGGKTTDSRQLRLEPFTTQTFEYHFYFPAVPEKAGGTFAHFPVHVITRFGAARASPFTFKVVSKLTEVDRTSWEYVSQYGTDPDVFAFLDQNNLANLDLERVAWRCRQSVDFYRRLVAYLNQHHIVSEPVFRYALLHNDADTLREWLKLTDETNRFLSQCGSYLASTLVTLDPIERRSYEHLEYSPFVNQRAHRVGSEWRIANPAVLDKYVKLLEVLAHKARLDAMDEMSICYFLFLQDRVDEALTRFKAVDASKLPTHIQHDYFQCYTAFYEGNLPAARGLAAKYADHPLKRWRGLFAEVTSQLDEIEGKAPKEAQGDKPDREKQQMKLAATEPGFDFKVENQTVTLNWSNLEEVTLNYYLMDPEFSFSSSPFVGQDSGRLSIIKPNRSALQTLPKGQNTLAIPLPGEYAQANVLVEIAGQGLRKTQAYHASTLKVAMTENYGRLETRDSTTDKVLPKTYIKVYAQLHNGTVRFYKDGYTDLRGRFDYASLNGPDSATDSGSGYVPPPASGLDYGMLKPKELAEVKRLSILILSDANGATVKEVNPPGQ